MSVSDPIIPLLGKEDRGGRFYERCLKHQQDKHGKETTMKRITRNYLAVALICTLTAVLLGTAVTAMAEDVLPRPEKPFGGKIGRTVKESIKDFPKEFKLRKARLISC